MKKTSRRNFGKALAAGLASLPGVSLANTNQQKFAEQKASNPAESQKLSEKKNQHDTPPTFLITQGSFIIELDKPLAYVTTTNGKKKYRRPKASGGVDAELDHIKIVDGSGEMLYRNDAPRGCEIVLTLEESLEAKIYGGSELIVEMTDTLNVGTAQSGPRKRPHKYVPSSTLILGIKVQKGTSEIYSVAHTEVASRLEEVRIMVWHKDYQASLHN